MNNQQLNDAWAKQADPNTGVLHVIDGKGVDSDFMTIIFTSDRTERVFERKVGEDVWIEVR